MPDRQKTKKALLEELAALRRRVRELEGSRIPSPTEEHQTQAFNALMRLFAKAASRQEYLSTAVKLVNIWSGCRYVGIRVLNPKGEIPYESYLGFSQEFWESENWLSVHKDRCACIRVITGSPEAQDLAAMTRGGSFYLDNSLKFIQGLTEEQRASFRGVCIKCGFKTIAIVPIAVWGKILGVIHLADEEGGKLDLKSVEFLEAAAFSFGQAIQKFSADTDDKMVEGHFRWLMEHSQDCVSLISLDGAYLTMNTAGCRLHDYPDATAVTGKSIGDDIVENPEAMTEAIRRAGAGAEAAIRYRSRGREGREIGWESMLTPVIGRDGTVTSILSIAKDITARRGG
ncbi:MAG: PAS domain S-box protein [Thermodesulfobacteriota bacterium]